MRLAQLLLTAEGEAASAEPAEAAGAPALRISI
jgi:hypothetical protein